MSFNQLNKRDDEEYIAMHPSIEDFYLGDIAPSKFCFGKQVQMAQPPQPQIAVNTHYVVQDYNKVMMMQYPCNPSNVQCSDPDLAQFSNGLSMPTTVNSNEAADGLALDREYGEMQQYSNYNELTPSSSYLCSPSATATWTYSDNVSESPHSQFIQVQEQQPMTLNLDVSQIISQRLPLLTILSSNLFDRCLYDSNGSQYIQQCIKSNPDQRIIPCIIDYILRNKSKLLSMYTHLHSSYVIQTVYKHCTEQQHQIMLTLMIDQGIVLKACKSKHSARVIHQVIKSVSRQSLIIFVNHLEKLAEWNEHQRIDGVMAQCLADGRLSSIIKAIIESKLPYFHVKFVQSALENDLVNWSCNIYGCRIVQAFIQNYGDKLDVHKLFDNNGYLYLCQTKYGNYVIQRIIEKTEWNDQYARCNHINRFREIFIDRVFIKENVVKLSRNKFGSNVVELCMKVASKKQLDALISIMISNDGYILNQLSRDSFGHFVVRTLNQCIVKSNCFQQK